MNAEHRYAVGVHIGERVWVRGSWNTVLNLHTEVDGRNQTFVVLLLDGGSAERIHEHVLMRVDQDQE